MKKTIVILLLCAIFVSFVFPLPAVAENNEQVRDYGEYLRSIEVVEGYPDGSLKENRYITQAEYVVLLAKMLKKIKVVRRGNLVKQTNFFDELINKAYHAYLILKSKILDLYYSKAVYFIPYYRKKFKVSKDSWFVPYIIYLKRNGFSLPSDFKPDSVLSTANAIKWLLGALSLDDSNLIVSDKGIDEENVVYVLSYEHGIPVENTVLAKPIKRGEAFRLVYSVLAK